MRIPLLIFAAAASCFAQVAYPGGTLSAPAYFANPPYVNAFGLSFPGSRLNDATGCTTAYTGGTAANHSYVVRLQAQGTPDTIEWQKDGGSWSSPINITGSCQILTDGVGIRFSATTGHTAGYVPTMAWIPSFAYIVAPAYFAIDAAHHKQVVIVAGTSCAGTPTWNDSGGTTTDCGVTWQDSGLDPPWNNYDQWTLQATINGGISAAGTSRQSGAGVVFRSAFQKLNDLLLAGDFAVDPTGQTDSTSALQALIYQSRVKGQAATVPGGTYAISGAGLQMIDGGEDLRCQSILGCTLLMKTANMVAVTIMGYANHLAGFVIAPVPAATSTTGVLVTTSAATAFPGATQNTQGNKLDDLYIVGGNSNMAAGVLIQGNATGEVNYTQGFRVHVQEAQDAWKDSTVAAEYTNGLQNNANWCTDCNFENSARCLYLNGVGEDHFDGLSLNGCNGISSAGTVSLTNGSTAVVGTGTVWTAFGVGSTNGAPFYAQGISGFVSGQPVDATHLTLSAPWAGATASGIPYGIGEAPIVIDSTPFGSGLHVPSAGNVIQWNTGEPVQTVLIFDPYTERNTFESPNIGYLGSTVYDMTGGKNAVLSAGNTLLPSYDAAGNPQLWIGASPHTPTPGQLSLQSATFQATETGNNDMRRIQRAANPGVANPIGATWEDFNPYVSGYYIATAASYQGAVKVLESNSAGPISGAQDMTQGGVLYGSIGASPSNPSATDTTQVTLLAVAPGTHPGTIAVTNGSAAVVGTGSAFTVNDVGRLLHVAGQYYLVGAFTDSTHIALAASFTGVSGSALPYTMMNPALNVIGDGMVQLANSTATCNTLEERGLFATSAVSGTSPSKIFFCGKNAAGTATTVQLASAAAGATFTPVLTLGGSSTGITYSLQFGSYQQAGPVTIATVHLTLTSKGSATGAAVITGLPVPVGGNSGGYFSYMTGMSGITSPTVSAPGGTSVLNLYQFGGSGVGALTDANFTNSSEFILTVIYY